MDGRIRRVRPRPGVPWNRLLAQARAGANGGATGDGVCHGRAGNAALEEEAAEGLEPGSDVRRRRVLERSAGGGWKYR